MMIDNRTLDHFLHCKYKAYLWACGASPRRAEYDLIKEKQIDACRQRFQYNAKSSYGTRCTSTGEPSASLRIPDTLPALLLTPCARGEEFHVTLDALEVFPGKAGQKQPRLAAVVVSSTEKITVEGKVSLTLKSIFFKRAFDQPSLRYVARPSLQNPHESRHRDDVTVCYTGDNFKDFKELLDLCGRERPKHLITDFALCRGLDSESQLPIPDKAHVIGGVLCPQRRDRRQEIRRPR
jgi:hypothetical protein